VGSRLADSLRSASAADRALLTPDGNLKRDRPFAARDRPFAARDRPFAARDRPFAARFARSPQSLRRIASEPKANGRATRRTPSWFA